MIRWTSDLEGAFWRMSGPSLYYREIKACNVSLLDNVVESDRKVARQVIYTTSRQTEESFSPQGNRLL